MPVVFTACELAARDRHQQRSRVIPSRDRVGAGPAPDMWGNGLRGRLASAVARDATVATVVSVVGTAVTRNGRERLTAGAGFGRHVHAPPRRIGRRIRTLAVTMLALAALFAAVTARLFVWPPTHHPTTA
ncbi:MAG: hypothetical protein M3198_11930, partial [Actinomycetota bacterium]|nr:hypothetical protein [Actinomycetota bacterium]